MVLRFEMNERENLAKSNQTLIFLSTRLDIAKKRKIKNVFDDN